MLGIRFAPGTGRGCLPPPNMSAIRKAPPPPTCRSRARGTGGRPNAPSRTGSMSCRPIAAALQRFMEAHGHSGPKHDARICVLRKIIEELDEAREAHGRIRVDPEICRGASACPGTGVRVTDILQLLAAGVTRAEILADYPYLWRKPTSGRRLPGVRPPAVTASSTLPDPRASSSMRNCRRAWPGGSPPMATPRTM